MDKIAKYFFIALTYIAQNLSASSYFKLVFPGASSQPSFCGRCGHLIKLCNVYPFILTPRKKYANDMQIFYPMSSSAANKPRRQKDGHSSCNGK